MQTAIAKKAKEGSAQGWPREGKISDRKISYDTSVNEKILNSYRSGKGGGKWMEEEKVKEDSIRCTEREDRGRKNRNGGHDSIWKGKRNGRDPYGQKDSFDHDFACRTTSLKNGKRQKQDEEKEGRKSWGKVKTKTIQGLCEKVLKKGTGAEKVRKSTGGGSRKDEDVMKSLLADHYSRRREGQRNMEPH